MYLPLWIHDPRDFVDPTDLPRKRKMEPSGRLRKNYKKKRKEKKDKPATEQQPAAISIIDEDEPMQSDEGDWEDILEEAEYSENDYEDEVDDDNDDDDENENQDERDDELEMSWVAGVL